MKVIGLHVVTYAIAPPGARTPPHNWTTAAKFTVKTTIPHVNMDHEIHEINWRYTATRVSRPQNNCIKAKLSIWLSNFTVTLIFFNFRTAHLSQNRTILDLHILYEKIK